MASDSAWQLRLFQKTLKKKLRLKALARHLGRIGAEEPCILITCGDNNGAMNYYLRGLGGRWTWADLERKSLGEMSEFLGEEVRLVAPEALPYADRSFDRVVIIDVHEHLLDPRPFTRELRRITADAGRLLITVPGGDRRKWVNRLKEAVGMTKEKYGHFREGYSRTEMKALMAEARIRPLAESTFSKFFTELLELGINTLYVRVLAKKSRTRVEEGTIAPATRDQVKSVEKTVKLYALVYPFFWLISRLDSLLFFSEGYVVIVEGQRQE
jgi:SAM-dependent methyltransferase